ncbi:MAG: AbrB/MazE/SpoVT family DNA-binding domain-containing protein [Beijerinckiaceae bacterium]
MQVCKWGDSLAVRLPKDFVDKMGLKPGDELEVVEAGEGQLHVGKFDRRKAFLETIEKFRIPLPDDYKFDRDEANRR